MAKDLIQAPGIEPDLDFTNAVKIKDNQTVVGQYINSDIVEFFQKLLQQGGIPANNLYDNNVNGHQFIEALYSAIYAHSLYPTFLNPLTGILKGKSIKIIPIGSWGIHDIDESTLTKSVSHGLKSSEWKTITNIDVILRNDEYTSIFPINTPPGGGSSMMPQGGVARITSSVITLEVLGGGFFDCNDFSSTVMNRGYISIEYTPD